MNDLNAAFEDAIFNQTAADDGRGFGYIRWGVVEGANNKCKALAFFVSLPEAHAAQMAGKDLMAESNAVAKWESTLEGPECQAFEWIHAEFVSVDADRQTWFCFR